MSDTNVQRMVTAWAGAVDRLVALAPLDAVIEELGLPAAGHTTTDERKALRAAAHATVARWLARDLALLQPDTASAHQQCCALPKDHAGECWCESGSDDD